jgi:hypothetical protein
MPERIFLPVRRRSAYPFSEAAANFIIKQSVDAALAHAFVMHPCGLRAFDGTLGTRRRICRILAFTLVSHRGGYGANANLAILTRVL